MKIILMGAPGAGKGTQAAVVSEALAVPTISTGELLRQAISEGSELGRKAKGYLDAGALVPDEIVLDIIRNRLREDDCKNGFILDGFPRTIAQAQALDGMGIAIDKVLDIEVSDEKITARMSGRRVCSGCGASYHLLYKAPAQENVCDHCGGALSQRRDDHPDTVLERLRVYHQQTEPLKDYYARQGKLAVVEGQEEVADTTRLTLAALGEQA